MNTTTFTQTKLICTELFNKHCKDRDESHGLKHANRVLSNSLEIVKNSNYGLNSNDFVIICAAAMLHDFADHKYEKGTNLKKILCDFLADNFGKDAKLILDIIERISFSKEVSEGDSKWKECLGEKGVILRNIISDGDKIDATGVIGLDRCIQYTKEKTKGISRKDLIVAVKKHIDEKLGTIDTYCRTPYGKRLAKNRISELNDEFNKFRSQ